MRIEEAENLLEALLEIDNEGPLNRDPDGDYVLSYSGAQFYARIIGEGRPVVQIFSVVAADVPPIPDLLSYINKLNAELSFVKVFSISNQVLIESEFLASQLSHGVFHNACRHVAEASDATGQSIHEIFDGTPRWQAGKKPTYKFGFSPD